MITKLSDINLDNIKFEVPVKKNKKYFAAISYNGEPLVMQTPKLEGCNVLEKSLLIKNVQLQEFIKSLESLSKTNCFENSKEWFNGKTFSFNFIQDSFKSNVNNDTIKLHISSDMILYDHEKKEVSLTDSIETSELILIYHISGLWISPHHIGLCLNISQIKVCERKFKLTEYAIDDSDTNSDYPSDIEEEPTDETFFDDFLTN